MTDNMKARPIENLLKYNQEIKTKHEEISNIGIEYTIVSTWVDVLTYVIDNYNCTPK